MPDGPIRLFYQRLHDLHAAAGWPSMRALQRATRAERRPTGINPTTIHDAFCAPRPARWEVVQEIVTRLGGDVDEFGQLWRDARAAQARDADVARTGAAPREGTRRPVPWQTPPDVFAFTGRGRQLKRLDELFADGQAPAVAVIAGSPGVGKTALAVHWAHQARDRFPDGQLYLDLRGHAHAQPVLPVDALARLLGGLGVPAADIPTEQDHAVGLYRTLLADRRVLVILDNANGPQQVRPVLPAGSGCAALVTSRERLSGLVAIDGARRLDLDALDAGEATALLARILGTERAAAEPGGVAALAGACAYLPLALRLAAATLADHPSRRIAELAAELRGDSLSLLEAHGDERSGIRAAFDLSYRALPAQQRWLFRLLGLVPGPDFTGQAAAALAGLPADGVGRLLESLASAHLLTQHVDGRYFFHDLLRRYAGDRAHAEETAAAREGALRRLIAWYLAGADAAATLAYPHRLRLPVPPAEAPRPAFADPAAALTWLDDERANLVAAIGHAADHGQRPAAWLLADTLRSYFWMRMHTTDLATATQAALRAAEQDGDARACAITLLSLSNIHHRARRYDEAITQATRALAHAEQAGWGQAGAAALGVLATVRRDAGDLEGAAAGYRRALALYREGGDRSGEALTLHHLGRTCLYLGQVDEGIETATAALDLYRQAGIRPAQVSALDTLGEICLAGGRVGEALGHHEQALRLARDAGDRGAEAYALRNLAEAYRCGGQPHRAAGLARTAVALARDVADIRIQADALNTLAAIHQRLGRHRDALAGHREALGLLAGCVDPYPEVQALIGMAVACHALGHDDRAGEHARRAVARCGGFRQLRRQAVDVLRGVAGREAQPEGVVDTGTAGAHDDPGLT